MTHGSLLNNIHDMEDTHQLCHTRVSVSVVVSCLYNYILSCGIHKKNKISRYDSDSDDLWVETNIDVSDIADKDYLFKVCI